MRLPGAAWVLLASGIATAVIAFLSGEWFAGQLWVPVAIAAVSAIAKWIETLLTGPSMRIVGQRSPATLVRVLFGG